MRDLGRAGQRNEGSAGPSGSVVFRFGSRAAAAACMAEIRRLTSASVWTDVQLLWTPVGEIAVDARRLGPVADMLERYGGRSQPLGTADRIARSEESASQARAVARRAVQNAQVGMVAGRQALDRAKHARELLVDRRSTAS